MFLSDLPSHTPGPYSNVLKRVKNLAIFTTVLETFKNKSELYLLVRCKAANLWNYVVCVSACLSVFPCVCVCVCLWTSLKNSHIQSLQRTINAVRDF